MIHPTCVIGEPPQDKSQDQKSGTDRSKIKIGKRNVIREYTCIHAPTQKETVIGNDNFIMTHCVVNHDCRIFNHCVLSSGVKLGGFCTVDSYANLGMNACVHQGVVIGAFTMIGMGAAVTKHVPPFCLLNPKYDVVRKINVVGMTRNGFSAADVDAVTAYYAGRLQLSQVPAEPRWFIQQFHALAEVAPIKRATYEVRFC